MYTDEMCKKILRAGINRSLDDGAKLMSRKTLWVYAKNNWPVIMNSIKEWEERGILKVLKDPRTANDDDDCLEMLKYIDRESPLEGWPS